MFTWTPSDLFHKHLRERLATDDMFSVPLTQFLGRRLGWEGSEAGVSFAQPGNFLSEFVKTTASGLIQPARNV